MPSTAIANASPGSRGIHDPTPGAPLPCLILSSLSAGARPSVAHHGAAAPHIVRVEPRKSPYCDAFIGECDRRAVCVPAASVTRSDPDEDGWRSEQIEAAVQETERYLRAHPNASDTLQGVQDWWLAGLATIPSVEVVQAALDRLVERGVVAERRVPGGLVYRRVREGETE